MCVQCHSAAAPYPACVCSSCSAALRKQSSNAKFPLGGIATHGYNSFLQSYRHRGERTSFPSTRSPSLDMRLFPADYSHEVRWFDRRNWISRAPDSIARWPHEYFVNAQDRLPTAVQRHDEDVRTNEPDGDFLFVDRELDELKHGAAISRYQNELRSHPSKLASLWTLIEYCCADVCALCLNPDARGLHFTPLEFESRSTARRARREASGGRRRRARRPRSHARGIRKGGEGGGEGRRQNG
jgi:hypothetical protein